MSAVLWLIRLICKRDSGRKLKKAGAQPVWGVGAAVRFGGLGGCASLRACAAGAMLWVSSQMRERDVEKTAHLT
ncbi:hypothetical protein H920_00465 [Fukomys damarensis]|uniref:Uncharacterized protein n=1 Tax=Fukomys damarensis TaxID=885580 RepID=A0A091E640_FUKDA|nr:hypothetical protein H920_00465 [Fukomys damarensis]